MAIYLWNVFYIVLNVSSAVGIIVANKLVFTRYNFRYGSVLTIVHFVVTLLCLELLQRLGWMGRKDPPIRSILPLCASFYGFVVLTNLSLQYNSVGFYQMCKVMTTPAVALIQALSYEVKFTRQVMSTLLITCCGVLLATLTEVKLNALGLIYAGSAILVTALYQVWAGRKISVLVLRSCSSTRRRSLQQCSLPLRQSLMTLKG